MRIYPISYSIPEESFIIPLNHDEKKYDMAPLIPGKKDTYIYENEDDYNSMYANSKYALTTKKGGWDCLRHYEILANGCIPIFDKLILCPFQTLNGFPKKQIIELTKEYNETGKIINYNEKRDEIFKIAKDNLTCTANAKYFLHKVFPNIQPEKYSDLKILMLCGTIGYRNVNYTRETLAFGLRKICGSNFIEYPKLNVLYKNCKKINKYIGKGFTYGGKLDYNIEENNRNSNIIEENIKNNYYDLIIYGRIGNKYLTIQPLEELLYWPIIKNIYNKNNIVFLYGNDLTRTSQDKCLLYHANYGICFVREYQEIRFYRLRCDRSGAKIMSMLRCESYCFINNLAFGGAIDRSSKYNSNKLRYRELQKYLEECKSLCKFLNLPEPQLNTELFLHSNITYDEITENIFDKTYLNFLYERCRSNFIKLNNNDNVYIIAIHIRRGDVTANGKWSARYIPNSYYINLIDRLKKNASKYNKNIQIYIFSERITDSPFDVFQNMDCILMLDVDVVQTWNYFIMSDLLVTAPGSFSVTPALLRTKGNVIYTENTYMIPLDDWIIAKSEQETKFIENVFT
jgi:hypothetical protein